MGLREVIEVNTVGSEHRGKKAWLGTGKSPRAEVGHVSVCLWLCRGKDPPWHRGPRK